MTSEIAAVTVAALRKSYGERTVLNGIDFSVAPGEVFGLLGPNGAGKTTTLETVVGLRRPSSGEVRVLGEDPFLNREFVTERLAVQPQSAALFPTLTVRETLDLFASFYARPRSADELLKEFDLADAADVRVRHLSGGQERRLLIGVALVGSPKILVLDEPSAGLDPQARHNLWELIDRQRQRGVTVLLSTHHMEEATRVCDRIAVVVRGCIVAAGVPKDLVREHSRESVVSFDVEHTISSDELRGLGAFGELVTEVRGSTTAVQVTCEDSDALLRRITFTPGLRARNIKVTHGSLEDLFLDLAGTGGVVAGDGDR